MTRDDIIRMARKAAEETGTLVPTEWNDPLLERFAALVAALAEPVGLVTHTLNCVCGAVWDIKTDGSEEMAHTPNTAPAHRKPLTYPQIHELDWPDGVSFEEILLFVRSIEAAHGIKEDKQ